MKAWAAWGLALGILGLAAYGFWEGTPRTIVAHVRSGDVGKVKARLARHPDEVHTRVFPQAYERASEQLAYETRFGKSPWEGRYLIHDAASRIVDPVPMLDLLAEAGADLGVRLGGRTLLHLAARDGNTEVAAWLLDHGADADAANDCEDCPEKGQTALHDAQALVDDAMSQLLLSRGARVDARGADGRAPLHMAADRGGLLGAFALCRFGADPTLEDGEGRTPEVLVPSQDRNPGGGAEAGMLASWLKPGGGCATVSAMALATGEPVPEDAAREVFARSVPREGDQAAR